MNLLPMDELDEMIAAGWGSTPRVKIPADWRDRPGPDNPDDFRGINAKTRRAPYGSEKKARLDQRAARMRLRFWRQPGLVRRRLAG